MRILAFDIGGTKIAYAIIDEKGILQTEVSVKATPHNSFDIACLLAEVCSVNSVDKLAIATAGVVTDNRLAGKPINLPDGYENIDFGSITGLPYIIENDANAAIWAEYKVGALHGCKNCAMLTLGTGVGCGLMLNGQIYRGSTGASGEVRFLISGGDLASLAQKNGCPETDCFKIKTLSDKGDVAATKTLQQWQDELVNALVSMQEILDLEAFALSGSLAKIVDYPVVENAVRQRIWQPKVRILPAQTGANSGLIGAALLWSKK
jgi:predicted NBD/HSP70 family sugar kinase